MAGSLAACTHTDTGDSSFGGDPCSEWHFPTQIPWEANCSGELIRAQLEHGRVLELSATLPLDSSWGETPGGLGGAAGSGSDEGAVGEVSLPTGEASCDADGPPANYTLHYLPHGKPFRLLVLGGDEECGATTPIVTLEDEGLQQRAVSLPGYAGFEHVSVRLVAQDEFVSISLWLTAEPGE